MENLPTLPEQTSYDVTTGEILDTNDAQLLRNVVRPLQMDVPGVDDFVYEPGFALHIRADAKAGQFKIGEDQFIGAKMDWEILQVNVLQNVKLFNYPPQNWLQVFYVNPTNNAVCHTLLKGAETLRNYSGLVIDLKISRRDIHKCIVTAKFQKREGKDKEGKATVYYVVAFEQRPNTDERVARLTEYRANNKFYDPDIEDGILRGFRKPEEPAEQSAESTDAVAVDASATVQDSYGATQIAV